MAGKGTLFGHSARSMISVGKIGRVWRQTRALDAGEEVLRAGDCAGFKAGDPDGHCLQNRGTAAAVVLEIGSRIPGEYATYSDIDMKTEPGVGYVHKDGEPYPKTKRRGPG